MSYAHILNKGRLAEHLLAMANLIETVGWCKGSYYKTDEQEKKIAFCLLGAHDYVNSTYANNTDAVPDAILRDALKPVTGSPTVGNWNDFQDSPEVIIGALNRAAQLVIEST